MTRLLALFLMLVVSAPAVAQFGSTEPMVDAALVSDRTSVAPGDTFHLALHQQITPGWHTYWRNPGDSGEPTRLELSLPDGWRTGEMIWPAPHSYDLGPLTNYGYSAEVTLPVPVTAPDNAAEGPLTINAFATWLVCEDICIPEEAELTLTLDVGASTVDRAGQALINQALEQAPDRAPDMRAGLEGDSDGLVLTLSDPRFDGASLSDVTFYPHDSGVIDHAADQSVTHEGENLRLDVAAGYLSRNGVDQARTGVLVYTARRGNEWSEEAVEFTAREGLRVNELAASSSSVAGVSGQGALRAPEPQSIGFLQAAGLALLGGLILNLMPCVFPVLSMKALTLVEKRGAERGEARALGLVFAAGVVGTFLVLGGLLLVLRVAGLPALWGMQLQAPLVVAGLATLMFLIGLNFLGVFEIGTSLQSVGSGVKDSGRRGAFLTGVLAVFVAAPCLAPFMTGALAFALTQPALASLTIFVFLGVGLAFPFVLVSFVPGLLNLLPRPGAWMTRFREILAFPMFATAIWLVWVLSAQLGSDGVLWLMLALLASSFTVWALRLGGPMGRITVLAGVLLTLGALSVTARLEPVTRTVSGQSEWAQWSESAVAEAQAAGRPVFVDFTAAWCVSCQVNKLGTLSDSRVRDLFAQQDVALFRADFTNRDPVIADALARHGAAGVPLYLVYPPESGDPEVLPPLLTSGIVIRAVNDAVN
ncbi:thio:disulfide interchange protein, putative [Oceanicaulis alexandrii HTCC2633]|uniref:protein-disulfide reductase DsbD family protein n=1 Tax=Oceanicaulis sp. HTCC2633 TaxID=314254 RepID=UPI000066C969|nr:protein-disulfide reductase DsbD domain-containing protein [Oceanicaulis sp. HTCC2633]EAP88722.1 thio:disulfide interchange protein, putative [Oceanicaulis alexandrii HTCC2633] [Oceanicaulis sp. HTCC2633]